MHQTATHAEHNPYHAAFEELGLSWDWDPARYGTGRAGLRAYVEQEHPHLLRAYDADFLFEAVEATRARLAAQR
ncbi:MAG TPA: hypothetical protein VFE74_02190 [Ramlibacter sp.]|nr:hypothetical protein [Ramlibacter sp.]